MTSQIEAYFLTKVTSRTTIKSFITTLECESCKLGKHYRASYSSRVDNSGLYFVLIQSLQLLILILLIQSTVDPPLLTVEMDTSTSHLDLPIIHRKGKESYTQHPIPIMFPMITLNYYLVRLTCLLLLFLYLNLIRKPKCTQNGSKPWMKR